MPKQFKTYTRFDGGLNTKTNARSIQDNELAQANNVIVDEFGVVKSAGKATTNTTNYNSSGPGVSAMQAGYGFFQTRLDSGSSFTTGVNNPVVSTFFTDADASGVVVVESSDDTGAYGDRMNLGSVTNDEQGKVIMHLADGLVRACDTNIENISTVIKKYGYFNTTSLWAKSNGSVQTPGGYAGTASYSQHSTLLASPTKGIASTGLIGTVTGASDTGLTTSGAAFSNDLDTDLDTGTYSVVNTTDGTFDTIVSRTNTSTLVTSAGGASFNNSGEGYEIYPPAGAGFNLNFTPSGATGTFTAGTYEFAITFLYDGNQESLPYQLPGTVAVSANNTLECTVLATQNLSSTTYAENIKGGRIYQRISGTKGPFIFFGEINFALGTKPTIDGEFTFWNDLPFSGSAFVSSTFLSTGPNLDTYTSLNGYSQDSNFISIGRAGEKYQTSVVSNRRTFIANVKYFNEDSILLNRGDQIRYSQINRFDTYPENNFLDIGVNDGEEFIKLEAFADRILAYKENTLYVINVGGGSDTQWFLESSNKNMGVAFHAAVAKTEFGVAWVNKNGLYFYDGSRITNLQNKIIEDEWKSFVNDDTMLGYEPTHKHLVVIRDAAASGDTSGDAYVYSFITKSFTFIEDLFANTIKTNIITDLHNNMSAGISGSGGAVASYDGEPDAGTTFDIKLKDDDFGLPNIVKKIYGVTVEYASDNDNTNGVKYFFTNDSGVKQGVDNAGTLSDTNNDLDVNRVTFGTPLLASSFQVQLDLDGDSIQKVNNVAVEYRPIYKRVT